MFKVTKFKVTPSRFKTSKMKSYHTDIIHLSTIKRPQFYLDTICTSPSMKNYVLKYGNMGDQSKSLRVVWFLFPQRKGCQIFLQEKQNPKKFA